MRDPTPSLAGGVPLHEHPYPFPDPATLSELAARMGGGSVPGVGTLENDTYFIGDSIDVNFPAFLDFVLPSNMVKLQAVKLSFKFRLFRAWSVTNASGSTGAGSLHGHSSETGHSHSHAHTLAIDSGGTAGTINFNVGTGRLQDSTGADTVTSGISTSAAGSSGHVHQNENSHTHAVTVSVSGQISETSSPTAVGVTVEGVDQTAALGGPFAGDAIELDITKYVTQPYTGVFHAVQLSTGTQGRLMAMLRVTYIANLLQP